MTYHSREIQKGVFGEVSKIREELEELEDSEDMGVKIMSMCELSDLYGALEEFAQRRYNLSMDDLKMMSDRTREAFRDGTRS